MADPNDASTVPTSLPTVAGGSTAGDAMAPGGVTPSPGKPSEGSAPGRLQRGAEALGAWVLAIAILVINRVDNASTTE